MKLVTSLDPLSPFKNSAFIRLFAAQVTSLIGSGFTQVALALMVFDMAGMHAAWVLGITWSMRVLAFVIFAPIFGGLSHHIPRKVWLIGLDVSRAVLLLSLLWIDEVWQLYVLIFLLNVLSSGFTPIFQALLPDILTNEKTYTRALAYSRLAFEFERMVSPALAGILLLTMNYPSLFALNSLTFMLSALLIAITTLPKQAISDRVTGFLHNINYGIRSYLHTPRLQGLLALQLVVSATGAMIIINTVGYIQGTLDLTERVTAWMMAVSGLGAIIAARLLPSLLDKHWTDRNLSLVASVIMIAALLGSIGEPSLLRLSLMWAMIGFGSAFVQTLAGRIITQSCQESDRSAFFAANFALSHAMWLIAYPIAGVLGTYGFSHAIIGLSFLALLGFVIALRVWPKQDKQVLAHSHAAIHHEHLHYHDEHHHHKHEGWEGEEPHQHPHHHAELHHAHRFVIDEHHLRWPRS